MMDNKLPVTHDDILKVAKERGKEREAEIERRRQEIENKRKQLTETPVKTRKKIQSDNSTPSAVKRLKIYKRIKLHPESHDFIKLVSKYFGVTIESLCIKSVSEYFQNHQDDHVVKRQIISKKLEDLK